MTENKHCCGMLGRWTIIAVVLVLAVGVLSWATMEQRKSIGKTLSEMENCSTFVTCVEKAGLGNVLEKDGPFTVFVPTNDAFEKISETNLKNLLNNRSALTSVILYHMVPKTVTDAEMENLGDCLTCTVPQTAIACNKHSYGQGKCVKGEIPCSNGFIYLIDAVQFPPFLTDENIAETDEIDIVEIDEEAAPADENANANAAKSAEAVKTESDKASEAADSKKADSASQEKADAEVKDSAKNPDASDKSADEKASPADTSPEKKNDSSANAPKQTV